MNQLSRGSESDSEDSRLRHSSHGSHCGDSWLLSELGSREWGSGESKDFCSKTIKSGFFCSVFSLEVYAHTCVCARTRVQEFCSFSRYCTIYTFSLLVKYLLCIKHFPFPTNIDPIIITQACQTLFREIFQFPALCLGEQLCIQMFLTSLICLFENIMSTLRGRTLCI